MRRGTPIGDGLRMAVYPIRPRQEKEVSYRCILCERRYTKSNKAVSTILGSATNNPVFAWECTDCASSGEYTPKYPGIVIEDTVDWQGDYWERSLHPSEARFKKALRQINDE